nr:DKNYY domain-containing protein [Solitalea agri]
MNPKRGCWNCGDCYFTDDKNVYYGLQKIKGADPKTFTLLNLDTIDAKDKNRKYFNGEPIE